MQTTIATASSLYISLLGPFQLQKSTQSKIKESRRKVQALLAYLVVESDQAHSREGLTALLWPEMSREEGRNNLRVTLAQLKKTVGSPNIVTATRSSIQLNPNLSIETDIRQFESLIHSIQLHAHQKIESCATCLENLEKAVSLYRGSFLSGLVLDDCEQFEEWVFVWGERLYLQVIGLLDRLAKAFMGQGEYGRALIYTRRQLELDPLYDHAQKRLLHLLALQNNVQAALTQFEQFKVRLVSELGIEPDREMVQLVADIRGGRFKASKVATPNVSDIDADAGLSKGKRGNLPESLTPFFGRELEIAQLAEKFARLDYRLISLVGQGGTGKSRLALEVARQNRTRFADGAFFVPLAPLTQAAQIPAAIEKALGIQLQSSIQTIEDQLIHYLSNRELLLVIDNIEHVLDGVELLLDILSQCQQVVLLITSRTMLDVQAEDLFQLEGLPYPKDGLESEEFDQFPAVRLFCNRARRLLKSFRLTAENRKDVGEICRLTEGLPLALELAATWIRDMPLADLALSIKSGYRFLQTSLRDIPPHHRSMQAVFESSWSRLSCSQKEMLAALSRFRGGFTALAISKITGLPPLDLIRLCNHSLVRRIPGSGRYELHELTRQFAAEKLAQDQLKQGEIEKLHASYYLSILQQETNPLIHTDPIFAFKRLQTDFDNIRMAWERGFTHHLFTQLQESLQGYVHYHIRSGKSWEMVEILRRNLSCMTTEEEALLRCTLLTYEGYLLTGLNDKTANEVVQKSLALAKNIKSPYLLTLNYYLKGKERNGQDDMANALLFLGKGEDLARKHRFLDVLMLILRIQGHSNFVVKNYGLAESQCQEAVELGQAYHLYPDVQLQALGELGNIASDLGRLEEGIAFLKRALDMQEKSGNPRDKALLLHHLASIEIRIGLNAEASEKMHISLKLCEEIGDHYLKNWARYGLAEALRKNDQPADALQALQPSLLDVGKYLHIREAGLVMLELGNCFYALKQLAKAKEMYQRALENFVKNGYLNEIILAQSGLAIIKLQEGDVSGACESIKPVLEKLENEDTTGWESRLRSYLHCCLVLKAVQDGRVNSFVMKSKAILDEMLLQIESEEIRRAMVENIPEHREILLLASQI